FCFTRNPWDREKIEPERKNWLSRGAEGERKFRQSARSLLGLVWRASAVPSNPRFYSHRTDDGVDGNFYPREHRDPDCQLGCHSVEGSSSAKQSLHAENVDRPVHSR